MPYRATDGWKWRRIVVFAVTLTSVVLPFCPDVNTEVFWPFYTLAAATVGAYIGFATWEDRGRPGPMVEDRGRFGPRTSRRISLDDPDEWRGG